MSLATMLGIDLPEQQAGWGDRGPLPYFWGRSFDEHVTEWRLVDREAQDKTWRLAAIAFSLERSSGGRPRGERARLKTAIQRFCEAVKTDRQTFQRYCRTYRTFVSITGTSGGTSFEPNLPFKFYEVAARLAGADALDAIAEAREKGWSANTLQRQLKAQREPSQKRRRVSLTQARERIRKMIAAWPEHDRRMAVDMLRRLAADIEQELGPPPLPRVEQIAMLEEIDALQEIEEDAPPEEIADVREYPPPP